MKTLRRYGRPNLFLVRVWPAGGSGDTDALDWEGTVQRVVDGESYQFGSLFDLAELLRVIIQNTYGGKEDGETH